MNTIHLLPKAAFQKTQHAAKLAEIVSDPAFRAGIDAALLQMQFELCSAHFGGTDNAAAIAHRMAGALRFKETLLRLTDTELPPKRITDSVPFPEL